MFIFCTSIWPLRKNFLVAIWLVPVSLGQPCFVLVWPGPIRSQEKCIQKWISTALFMLFATACYLVVKYRAKGKTKHENRQMQGTSRLTSEKRWYSLVLLFPNSLLIHTVISQSECPILVRCMHLDNQWKQDGNHTCFGYCIQTTRCFRVIPYCISRFTHQNKRN